MQQVVDVRTRVAVGATYAAQGFGYATVVTALPGLKARTGIDDAMISVVLLMGALLAAAGSVAAERIARRWSSRSAVVLGLLAQAAGLALVASATSVPVLVVAFVAFALGLGMVDASSNMQGVALQHHVGRPIVSTLFACLTVAAITAALVQSGLARLGTTTGAVSALVVAVLVAAAVALLVRPVLLDSTASQPPPADDHEGILPGARTGVVADAPAAAPARTPLPRAGLWVFGALVAAAFVVDAAVSSWSTVYLHDELAASASVAPLGYAAYQGAVLIARLLGDPLVRRHGRVRVAAPTGAVAAAGLVLVALVPSPEAAIVGFALAGIGAGTLVPLAFSAAGELAPDRLDDVIARINLFNYAGALIGSVSIGLLAGITGIGPGFLVPALLLVPAMAAVPRLAGARVAELAGGRPPA
ncbi:MFS transporter [Cellulomonas sp. zg-ZUI222]|uniref:MFS transporter n=1 Tax=Cellulomonas wangleii TaxID=2816956 RepID=A0ABX8D5R1_9CELL|nr:MULTISPECIES: MFS transporter [Cellulomonas]MBO0898847.1 MFS transporter [Cellulomonas sp. zg-ZUI22]MBO0919709.1 MFS transporter [Cellulomonas wangleii]MBO0923864.1 MFS transporter [Cellulomonas wangleii]MBO0924146.1 MFS transporter [Cellulomonas wangleii]QVI62170.1 MFS transporter [Cellulomonas wangleii]